MTGPKVMQVVSYNIGIHMREAPIPSFHDPFLPGVSRSESDDAFYIILKSIAPRALYQMPTRFPAQRRPAAVY